MLKYLLYLTIFPQNINADFGKANNTQHCLLTMLKKWKKHVDKGKVFSALLTAFSKAFDCLDHESLAAKLSGDYKDIDNLNTFKNNSKKWKPKNSPCRLCKIYINNIGLFENKRET